MTHLELNKSGKRKRQKKQVKLLPMPNLKPRLMPPNKESESPEPRSRRIVSSMRPLDKPNMTLLSKESPKRRQLPQPNNRLLKQFREESKLKILPLP